MSAPFVCLTEQFDATRLTGTAAQYLLKAGQMLHGRGAFEDGSETGGGIFLVLRSLGYHSYLMAPFGSADPYWADHLSRSTYVKVQLMRSAGEKVPSDTELLRRWRVMSEHGEEPKKADYEGFPRAILNELKAKWQFLNELVVSDVPQVQAGSDSPHLTVTVIS